MAATSRARFRRARASVLFVALAIGLAVAAVGALLVAPRSLAAVRLLDVSLGWWAMCVAFALEIGALVYLTRTRAA